MEHLRTILSLALCRPPTNVCVLSLFLKRNNKNLKKKTHRVHVTHVDAFVDNKQSSVY